MIQYLGEHKLFNEKYIIFILFCIFLIEFKNYFSHKNKEKGYTLVISLPQCQVVNSKKGKRH